MRSSTQKTAPVAAAFLTGFAGLAVWAAHLYEITNPEWSLILLTALLVGYLLVEVRRVSRRAQHALASQSDGAVFSHDLYAWIWADQFCLFPAGRSTCPSPGVRPGVTYWMILNLLALVLLGAIAMWLAYWSRFAVDLGRKFQRSRFLDRLLRTDWGFSAGRDCNLSDY